jgi:hypothetical protein
MSLQFSAMAKSFKKLPLKLHFREFEEAQMLHIHSSNGKMASSDCCYCDWAPLSVTQSSNMRGDVVGVRCYWKFESSRAMIKMPITT